MIGLLFRIGVFPLRLGLRTIRLVGLRRIFLVGVGLVAGMLLAPTTGADLRRRIGAFVQANRRVPDADLAESVRNELAHSPRTWHLPQPSVSVLRGRVVLTGAAPHEPGRRDLERAAAGVPGVLAVDNEIVVVADEVESGPAAV